MSFFMSQLKADKWDELLEGYWDTQLPLLVRYGFPLDFDRSSYLESHTENHNSAKNYPHDIQAYIREECTFGAILGPFHSPPIKHLHTSPFMMREKPNGPHRRVIVDLSFPLLFSFFLSFPCMCKIRSPYGRTGNFTPRWP